MDHVLDATELAAPEPMERMLDTLAELPTGDRLLLRLRRQPFPLYEILRNMGYRWEVVERDGIWEISIEVDADET